MTLRVIKLTLLCFVLFSFSTITIDAQNIVVKVKYGSLKLANKTFNENMPAFNISDKDSIYLSKGTLVLARLDVIVIELKDKLIYTGLEIRKLIENKKKSNTGGIATIAFKEPIQRNYSYIKGSATRGFESSPLPFFYPYDSLSVADEKIRFFLGNSEATLKNQVTIKNLSSGEVKYIQTVQNNSFELKDLKEGTYEWSYTLVQKKQGKVEELDFLNIFYVPTDHMRNEQIKKVNLFLKSIKEFSTTMQIKLAEDVIEEYRFYLPIYLIRL